MPLGAESVDAFLDGLASKAATPGGGSAAALMGALGGALTSMVCHLTLGRRKFADVGPEMAEVLAAAEAARAAVQDLMERDASAFAAYMAAVARPRDDPARRDAMQAALRGAAEVPLACARAAAQVVSLAARAAAHGNPAVISDAGVAALAAGAALRSAALNVYVNAAELDDRVHAEEMLQDVDALVESAQAEAEAVYASVRGRLL